MNRRSVESVKGALAALALVSAACAPSAYARSERGYPEAPAPKIQSRSEPIAANSAASEDHATPAQQQPAPVAEASTASASSAREPAQPAGELQANAAPAQTPGTVVASSLTPELPELWRLERGQGEVPLLLPRDETLVFEVHLNLGWIGSPNVGKVTMTSEVRPFLSDVPGRVAGEQVTIAGRAQGSYKVYTLDTTISSSILPQAWPRVVHRNEQSGTENRKRELMFGIQDGKESSRSRIDTHCKGCKDKAHFVSGTWPWQDDAHCKKCKHADHRVWKEPKTRKVPAGALDMMTAVYLARSLVIDGRERIQFPLVDNTKLWQIQLTRGKTKTIETSAGKFKCVAIELRTSDSEEAAGSEATKFEGLFGIHGTISIWMEAVSGVPVRIDGTIPVGPIELDATVELHKARGTPRAFAVQH